MIKRFIFWLRSFYPPEERPDIVVYDGDVVRLISGSFRWVKVAGGTLTNDDAAIDRLDVHTGSEVDLGVCPSEIQYHGCRPNDRNIKVRANYPRTVRWTYGDITVENPEDRA